MSGDTPTDATAAEPARPTLAIEVVWGSITEPTADVYAVGHYQGVLPQNAEAVLDKAVSAIPGRPVIKDLTERGVIRGALGDVNFIPWDTRRMVAIAGMGAPGTFRTPQLRKLVAGLVSTTARLHERRQVASVLIGSGVGTMTIAECVRGFLEGLHDAFEAYPSLALDRLRIVEHNLDRALAIMRSLEDQAKTFTSGVAFDIHDDLEKANGRKIPDTFSYSLLLAAVAKETGAPGAELHEWLKALLKNIPALKDDDKPDDDTPLTKEQLDVVNNLRLQAKGQPDLRRLALSFPIGDSRASQSAPSDVPPTRVVLSFDGRHVRTSAITEMTTVSEREVGIRQELFDDLILWLTRSNGLPEEDLISLGRFAFERLVHAEMDDVFTRSPSLILELNRSIAGMPFEMLIPSSAARLPLALSVPIARQLRTTYSPPPISAPGRRIETALVIGDPGEGEYGLPECREEAKDIAAQLSAAGIKTTLLVGSPRDVTGVLPAGARPASMVAVQQLLFSGVDLVHYCGHGVYEPDRPDLSGWVFGNGNILAAEDLRQLRKAPLLVMANACLSANLSQRRVGRRGPAIAATSPQPGRRRHRPAGATPDVGLIAGLADEFFRQGVRDFVGAAFMVPDLRARELAKAFYAGILKGDSLGEALKAARGQLHEAWQRLTPDKRAAERNVSPVWGAYQHYGDPVRRFVAADK